MELKEKADRKRLKQYKHIILLFFKAIPYFSIFLPDVGEYGSLTLVNYVL